MSRHRNVRNLIDEDYYDYKDDGDYDDDYDDEEYYYQQQQKQQKQQQQQQQQQKAKLATTKKSPPTNTAINKQQQQQQQQLSNSKQKDAIEKNRQKQQQQQKQKQQQQQQFKQQSSASIVPQQQQRQLSSVNSDNRTVACPPTSVPTTTATTTTTTVSSSSLSSSSTVPSSSSSSTTNTGKKIPPCLLQKDSYSSSPSKGTLTVVVLGHVDAGKSTLTGRLLYHANNNTTVSTKNASRISSSSSSNGSITNPSSSSPPPRHHATAKTPPTTNKTSSTAAAAPIINYAWLLDEDENERVHGITMDIATKTLATPANVPYDIILLDSPGHVDYIPAMITGTANADVAMIVVDATSVDMSLSSGQLREHIYITRGLGISQLLIVINKLDIYQFDYNQYAKVQKQLLHYLTSSKIGFQANKIRFIPVSGINGINVIRKQGDNVTTTTATTTTATTNWYDSYPTLQQALYQFDPPPIIRKKLIEKPLRIILSDIDIDNTNTNSYSNKSSKGGSSSSSSSSSSSNGVSVRAKIVQGYFQLNEPLLLLPTGDITSITKMIPLQQQQDQYNTIDTTTISEERSKYGVAGDMIECTVVCSSNNNNNNKNNNVDLHQRLFVGSILCRPIPIEQRPKISNHFRARIFLLDNNNTSTSGSGGSSSSSSAYSYSIAAVPIIRGASCIFHIHYIDIPCHFSALLYTFKQQQQQTENKKKKTDRTTTATTATTTTTTTTTNDDDDGIVIDRKNPRALTFPSSANNATSAAAAASSSSSSCWAMVELTLSIPICIESFHQCKTLGRFVLRRNGTSIAIGRIEEVY